MSSDPPRLEGGALRRARSMGDLPATEINPCLGCTHRSCNHRYSESHTHIRHDEPDQMVPFSNTFPRPPPGELALPPAIHRGPRSSGMSHNRSWTPPATVVEDPEGEPRASSVRFEDHSRPVQPTPRQHNLSLYTKTMAYFGYGRAASRTRRELVSLIWNLGWGFVQVCRTIPHPPE